MKLGNWGLTSTFVNQWGDNGVLSRGTFTASQFSILRAQLPLDSLLQWDLDAWDENSSKLAAGLEKEEPKQSSGPTSKGMAVVFIDHGYNAFCLVSVSVYKILPHTLFESQNNT